MASGGVVHGYRLHRQQVVIASQASGAGGDWLLHIPSVAVCGVQALMGTMLCSRGAAYPTIHKLITCVAQPLKTNDTACGRCLHCSSNPFCRHRIS